MVRIKNNDKREEAGGGGVAAAVLVVMPWCNDVTGPLSSDSRAELAPSPLPLPSLLIWCLREAY